MRNTSDLDEVLVKHSKVFVGCVGTAHIEKREEGGASPHRRKKKNLEEDKVQRAHDSAD